MKEIARYFRVGRSTVSKVIPEVCSVIWDVVGPMEFPPLTEEKWRADAAEFDRRWNFPRCVGTYANNFARSPLISRSFVSYVSMFLLLC